MMHRRTLHLAISAFALLGLVGSFRLSAPSTFAAPAAKIEVGLVTDVGANPAVADINEKIDLIASASSIDDNHRIYIGEVSGGKFIRKVILCPFGKIDCGAYVKQASPGAFHYKAAVIDRNNHVVSKSGKVTIDWKRLSIRLSVTDTAGTLKAGQQLAGVNVTFTVTAPEGMASSWKRIVLAEARIDSSGTVGDSQQVGQPCGEATCRFTLAHWDESSQDTKQPVAYRYYAVASTDSGAGRKKTDSTTDVTWTPWKIHLFLGDQELLPGQRVDLGPSTPSTLRASVENDLLLGGQQFHLRIYDQDLTGNRTTLADCTSTQDPCTADVPAAAADSGGYIPEIHATVDSGNVDDPTTHLTEISATLHTGASLKVSWNGEEELDVGTSSKIGASSADPLASGEKIVFKDSITGEIVYDCGTDNPCAFDVSVDAPREMLIEAEILDASGKVRAVGNTDPHIKWLDPPKVTLTTDFPSPVTALTKVTFTAKAEASHARNWELDIVDRTKGELVAHCVSELTCEGSASNDAGTKDTYLAELKRTSVDEPAILSDPPLVFEWKAAPNLHLKATYADFPGSQNFVCGHNHCNTGVGLGVRVLFEVHADAPLPDGSSVELIDLYSGDATVSSLSGAAATQCGTSYCTFPAFSEASSGQEHEYAARLMVPNPRGGGPIELTRTAHLGDALSCDPPQNDSCNFYKLKWLDWTITLNVNLTADPAGGYDGTASASVSNDLGTYGLRLVVANNGAVLLGGICGGNGVSTCDANFFVAAGARYDVKAAVDIYNGAGSPWSVPQSAIAEQSGTAPSGPYVRTADAIPLPRHF